MRGRVNALKSFREAFTVMKVAEMNMFGEDNYFLQVV